MTLSAMRTAMSVDYFLANLLFGAACNILGPTLLNLATNVNSTPVID